MVRPSEVRFPRIGELSPFHQLLDVHGMDFAMVASREQRNEKQRQGVLFFYYDGSPRGARKVVRCSRRLSFFGSRDGSPARLSQLAQPDLNITRDAWLSVA